MSSFSFRVTFTAGQAPVLDEVDPATPPGVYQVSGFDNRGVPGSSEQVAVTIVQHDETGKAIVGGTGFLGS